MVDLEFPDLYDPDFDLINREERKNIYFPYHLNIFMVTFLIELDPL